MFILTPTTALQLQCYILVAVLHMQTVGGEIIKDELGSFIIK